MSNDSINPKLLNQAEHFLQSEGDQWFARNVEALKGKQDSFEIQYLKRILGPFKTTIDTVLEIGCSSGVKLQQLCDSLNAKGKGIDPSSQAVKAGNQLFINQNKEHLELTVGAAHCLPYGDHSFDLVFFGFCLYLVDRAHLFKAVAEADRVLKTGGFLEILDFDPIHRHKRPYHHKEGIFTYKHQYTNLFIDSGHYYLMAKESFSHAENFFSKDSNERISVNVLYKEIDAY